MTVAVVLCLITSLLQLPTAIATFDGVFKSREKNFLEVQVEGGETMRMYTTRSTRYVRHGRAARADDFHKGEPVTVDAERDARLNLVAVKVQLANTKPEK